MDSKGSAMTYPWLPPLITLADCGGQEEALLKRVHQEYCSLFKTIIPPFMGLSVAVNQQIGFNHVELTFWHLVSVGEEKPEQRKLDHDRCARIQWPLKVMERCPEGRPPANAEVVWWRERRKRWDRIHLALADFSYIVVLEDRQTHAVFWTAFPTRFPHEVRGKQRAYAEYWASVD